jgi:hypothetical protein
MSPPLSLVRTIQPLRSWPRPNWSDIFVDHGLAAAILDRLLRQAITAIRLQTGSTQVDSRSRRPFGAVKARISPVPAVLCDLTFYLR